MTPACFPCWVSLTKTPKCQFVLARRRIAEMYCEPHAAGDGTRPRLPSQNAVPAGNGARMRVRRNHHQGQLRRAGLRHGRAKRGYSDGRPLRRATQDRSCLPISHRAWACACIEHMHLNVYNPDTQHVQANPPESFPSFFWRRDMVAQWGYHAECRKQKQSYRHHVQ